MTLLYLPGESLKYTCSVSEFTEAKWQAVGATARYGIDFASASHIQKKGASYLFLEENMKALMDQQERACALPQWRP